MKTIQDLENFYQTTMLPKLKVLENERKAIVKNLVIDFILIWGILGIYFGFCYYQRIQGPFYVIVPIIICCYISQKKLKSSRDSYLPMFKSNVMGEIVGFVDEGLNYSASRYIDESDFIRSHIFNLAHDIYTGDDYVWGKIGKTEIMFSELYSGYKVAVRGCSYWQTVFKGLFFVADFNKNFNGKTIVLPDKAERFLGRFGRTIQSTNNRRGQLINLEDIEFEKYFVVYSDDQVESRYILSMSLMKRITEFKKNTKRQISLSFVDSKIYVAISYTEDLFETKLHKSLLDFKPIQKYFEDIQIVTNIVNDLNLDTRIWTKN